jgi:DNA-binding transcriptional ArsR family regulator
MDPTPHATDPVPGAPGTPTGEPGTAGAVLADSVVLDASSLRGLAHPLRVRLLGLLRASGPSTATRLAARIGESSGSTSYHLRQLAAHGFITEDPARAADGGRERWWRAVHASTSFDPQGLEGDDAAIGIDYLRAVAGVYAANTESWLAAQPDAPQAWQRAGDLSDVRVMLTPREAEDLARAMLALVVEAERRAGADPDARPVVVQVQVLPQFADGER